MSGVQHHNKDKRDLYSINYDFTGTVIKNSEEIVSFKSDTTMRIWFNDLNRHFPTHWHSALEIIVPIENYYDACINNCLYHILPDEVLIIPPGELHSLSAPPVGERYIYLFDISFITKIKGFSSIQSILSQPIHITKDTYPKIYDDLYSYLLQMRNEYFSRSNYCELSIYSLLLNLFVKLGCNRIDTVNLFPNVRLYKQKEYIQKFNTLLEFIDGHYMEDLNLESIASTTGFSKYHFSRLFKQYTGFTFCDYLNYRRIKIAEELLAKPDYSITEVALQSGFPSISTFNRVFRKQKDCTPSEYRTKSSQSDL